MHSSSVITRILFVSVGPPAIDKFAGSLVAVDVGDMLLGRFWAGCASDAGAPDWVEMAGSPGAGAGAGAVGDVPWPLGVGPLEGAGAAVEPEGAAVPDEVGPE